MTWQCIAEVIRRVSDGGWYGHAIRDIRVKATTDGLPPDQAELLQNLLYVYLDRIDDLMKGL
jgi:hypothetical protein